MPSLSLKTYKLLGYPRSQQSSGGIFSLEYILITHINRCTSGDRSDFMWVFPATDKSLNRPVDSRRVHAKMHSGIASQGQVFPEVFVMKRISKYIINMEISG